jgi:DNA polymerase
MVWHYTMHKRYGWPDIFFNQWRCIMAQAVNFGMPAGLDMLCEVLNLPVKKDREGHDLMMKMAKPRKILQADKIAFLEEQFGEGVYKKKELKEMCKDDGLFVNMPILWHDSKGNRERLGAYCIDDTEAEFHAMVYLPDMPDFELERWQLDQRINLRGVPCDVDAVKATLQQLAVMDERSREDIAKETGGLVKTANQRDKIKEFCRLYGVDLPDLQADTVEAILKRPDELPYEVQKVLELRQLMAKAGMKKYLAMWDRVRFGNDRFYGVLMYMGAPKTGRWSSIGIQLHNMVRGVIKGMYLINFCIDCILQGCPDLFYEMYEIITDVYASLTRSMIKAPPGYTLVVADFAAIEARIAFWIAGETEALDIIRATDADPESNPDIYRHNAGDIYGKDPWETNDDERQTGKMSILGFQYGMAEEAFQTQALEQWGVELLLEFCAMMKDRYRAKYKRVVAMWKALGRAAIQALRRRTTVRVGRFAFSVKGKWLRFHLPSGRTLWYYKAQVVTKKKKNKDGSTWTSEQVAYYGKDSKSKAWKRLWMYGAKFFQHATQALARDAMAVAMVRADPLYPLILTVHDELVALVKKRDIESGKLSLAHFIEIIIEKEGWLEGCPIAADGFIDDRYHK